MAVRWHEFPDAAALNAAVADRMEQSLRDAVVHAGHAAVALAGGSTPLPIYRLLAARKLPWAQIQLLPTDERWVAASDPANNATQLADCFAGTDVAIMTLVPAAPGRPTAQHAAANLQKLPETLCLSLLGMGGDGHFASLFPGSAELDAGLTTTAACLVVRPDPLPPEAPYARISLSLSRLLHSEQLWLVIRGEPKRAVAQAALADADPARYPVAALFAQANNCQIFWSP